MDEAATASLRYVSLRTLIKKGTVPIKREYGSEFCEKPFGAYSHDVERRRDYEKQEIKLRNVVEKCAQGKKKGSKKSKKTKNKANAGSNDKSIVPEADDIDQTPDLKREYKKEIRALQLLLRHDDVKDHDEILEKIFNLQAKIIEVGKISSESLDFLNCTEKKRYQLQQTQKLMSIYNLYWYTFRVFTHASRNGAPQLTEEGYTKFHVLLQFAVNGIKDIDDALLNAEVDYRHDCLAYGVISELEFYDILQNLLEEVVAFKDVLYFSAFAWAVLDSIADCSCTPPKLRALRKVKCITKLENEASIITGYIKDKKARADMAVNNDKLGSFLSAQQRMIQRKQGVVLDDKKIQEVGEYLQFFDKNTWKGSGPSIKKKPTTNDGEVDDAYVDDNANADANVDTYADAASNDEESDDDDDQFDNSVENENEGKNALNRKTRKIRNKRLTHLEMLSELDDRWRRSTAIRSLLQIKQQDNAITGDLANRNSLEVGKIKALEEKLAALREKFYREHMSASMEVALSIEERLKRRNETQGTGYLRQTFISFSRRVSNFVGINVIAAEKYEVNKLKEVVVVDDDDDDDDDDGDDDGKSEPPMLAKPPSGGGFLKQLSQKFFTAKVASEK